MKNKIFTRIIITTLLCAFLTFNVGKVTRVSAVGTTIAASAAAALCAVGVVYCSYMALTGASVHVPDTVENIETWLQDMGSKVIQYPSGREAYEEIYPNMLSLNPATTLIHDFLDSEVWTWTADKLKSWANDFSSTDVIESIATFDRLQDVNTQVTNHFEYSNLQIIDGVANSYHEYPLSNYAGHIVYGVPTIYDTGYQLVFAYYYGNTIYRNILHNDGFYGVQQFNGSTWSDTTSSIRVGLNIYDSIYGINTRDGVPYWWSGIINNATSIFLQYPMFPQADIYVEATGEVIVADQPETHVVVRNPQYPTLPPEDDNKPVIPYLKLPYDPNWVDPLGGPNGGGNWGLKLGQVLDALEELAGLLMEIGAIGELINQFKDLIDGQSGDEYYIYYDDSTNNYYQYYTITNYGDNIYNYDIDVSEADEHLPVDLNTIQTYSSNRYLEQIKQSAINGSSIIRDFAVFWYDVDPEVTYIALGICILILIGAFTGKLGHS